MSFFFVKQDWVARKQRRELKQVCIVCWGLFVLSNILWLVRMALFVLSNAEFGFGFGYGKCSLDFRLCDALFLVLGYIAS